MPYWHPPRRVVQRVRILLSLLTLGGHLLPPACTNRRPVAVSLQARPITAGLGCDEIVYRYPATGEGFVVHRDRDRFFRLLRRTARTCLTIACRFGRVRRQYRAAYAEMVSDENWRRLLGLAVPAEAETWSPDGARSNGATSSVAAARSNGAHGVVAGRKDVVV
jgi:hypothetical protein